MPARTQATTVIGEHEFTIYDNLTIEVWNASDPVGTPPWFRQESYPDNKPFENYAAAEKWATDFLNEVANPPVVEESVEIPVEE